MCLHAKRIDCRIAEEDIKCYKKIVLSFRIDGSSEYRTPYCRQYISDEILSGKEPLCAVEPFPEILKYDSFRKEGVVEEGAIHTYAQMPLSYQINKALGEECYECIIPKGTKYHTGVDGSFNSCYASEKIIFKKKCEYVSDN